MRYCLKEKRFKQPKGLVVRHDDELKELADSFAAMYREVGAYITMLCVEFKGSGALSEV